MSNGNDHGNRREPFPPPASPSSWRGGESDEVVGDVPDDAFILPEDDLVVGRDMTEALIDPDTPVVRSRAPVPPDDFEEVMGRARSAAREIGEATGIGDEIHMDLDPYLSRWGDPHLARVAAAVVRLARAVEERGEAGLRTSPDMSRFEATLRAYCVGYLGGLRSKDS